MDVDAIRTVVPDITNEQHEKLMGYISSANRNYYFQLDEEGRPQAVTTDLPLHECAKLTAKAIQDSKALLQDLYLAESEAHKRTKKAYLEMQARVKINKNN